MLAVNNTAEHNLYHTDIQAREYTQQKIIYVWSHGWNRSSFFYSDNYSLYLHILALLWDTIIKINLQKKRKGKKNCSWHMVCVYDNYSLGIWEKGKPQENMISLIVVFWNDKNNNFVNISVAQIAPICM